MMSFNPFPTLLYQWYSRDRGRFPSAPMATDDRSDDCSHPRGSPSDGPWPEGLRFRLWAPCQPRLRPDPSGACTSRVRGHSERSLYATGRAAILKPTAVSCRVGMSGLRNKAICDEIRKFGYPISWLKPPPPACWYGGEMVELLLVFRRDTTKPGLQDAFTM